MLLVSHDRAFLDNVVTQTLAAEGDGALAGICRRLQRLARAAARGASRAAMTARGRAPGAQEEAGSRDAAAGGPGADGAGAPQRPESGKPAKLSYKESRELEHLPARIEVLESEQRELAALMASGDYHKRGGVQIRVDAVRAAEIEQALEAAFERWADLDMRRNTPR